jgi:uncharacterized protein (TIGR02246 family)
MSRFTAVWALGSLFVLASSAGADDKPAAGKTNAPQTAEEKIISEKAKAYLDAFNRGDAAALAAHYAKDGEVVDRTGKVTKGREAIQKELEAYFTANKGVKAEQTCDGVRQVTPDVIIERGCLTITMPKGKPMPSRYTAVLVKRDGQWLIENLRTTDDTATVADGGPLYELDFLIGEWVEANDHSVVHTVAEWTPGKKYIFRTFSIYLKDRVNTQGTEIIAWDPATKSIRGWVFESDGSFGERQWSKQDGRWTVKCTGTLADGKKMSSVNIVRPIDANRIGWQSTARDIGGRLQPNTEEIIVVRKQPKL